MNLPVLPLFPHGALDSAVITTVWVGVAVVAFFNLRFGWVLSGLVVPGYVVPLLLLKPWSAAVVFIEGIVTYLVVWGFSERLSRLGYWSSLFGRDRFFALVLVSVAVRLLFDGWLLPGIGAWVNTELGLLFDYRNSLHSFGLIIIALIANQFWKTGLVRGLVPMAVTVGVTFLIVRYGLMTVTNFTVSTLGYMYEDIASSILASPKAYIVLLTVAFVASRMNLLYGWDFSGILIPSLLALQWYQPGKVLLTFLEALLILWFARLLLRTRWLRNSNIEGARKLLLFFNINFVYKLLVAYLCLYFFPQLKITDTYAFGYLLATLVAIKMYDKDIAVRLTRATLQTSLVGVAVASLVGFGLTLLPLSQLWTGPGAAVARSAETTVLADTLQRRLHDDKVLLYEAQKTGYMPLPLTTEMQAFTQGIEVIKGYLRDKSAARLNVAAEHLARAGYELLQLEGRYLYLRETQPTRGWGLYVIDSEAQSRLLVEVPAPLDERGTFEAGTRLFFSTQAGALSIAGSRRTINADGSADVLVNRETAFHLFHRTLARRDVIQLRGYTTESARVLAGIRTDRHDAAALEPVTSLWVQSRLPPGVDLAALKELVGELVVEWRHLPFSNRQRETTRSGFAELVLNASAVRRLRTRSIRVEQEPLIQVGEQRIDGYLQEWLLGSKQEIAPRGSDLYRPPETEELLYFDEEILTPLLSAMQQEYRGGSWTPEGIDEIRAIQAAALTLDYRVLRYRHSQSGQDFLILFEDEQAQPRRYWGTYVFRLGPAQGYMVQVPRPLFEMNSFEYGVSLFERLQAQALLVAGAHPAANLNGSADIVRMDYFSSLFSLVNQVILREAGETPLFTVHSRAMGYREDVPAPQAQVLVSFAEGNFQGDGEQLAGGLLAALEGDGLSYRFVDGGRETAGYEVGNVPQSLYLDATRNKGFGVLWLSPDARAAYRQQGDNRQELARFRSLGIETLTTDIGRYVLEQPAFADQSEIPEGLREAISRYQTLADIVTLRRLQVEWPGYSWQRLIDRDSQQSFLALRDARRRLCLVANLNPRQADQAISMSAQRPDPFRIRQFVEARAGLLEFGA